MDANCVDRPLPVVVGHHRSLAVAFVDELIGRGFEVAAPSDVVAGIVLEAIAVTGRGPLWVLPQQGQSHLQLEQALAGVAELRRPVAAAVVVMPSWAGHVPDDMTLAHHSSLALRQMMAAWGHGALLLSSFRGGSTRRPQRHAARGLAAALRLAQPPVHATATTEHPRLRSLRQLLRDASRDRRPDCTGQASAAVDRLLLEITHSRAGAGPGPVIVNA